MKEKEIIVRRLQQEDIEAHNKTTALAFVGQITPEDNCFPSELMYGAFVKDGTVLASDMECIPFSVYYDTGVIGCCGVAGVATRPEWRHGGCIRYLFQKMDEQAEENGFDISILFPFSTGFYEKLGYGNLGYKVTAEMDFSYLSYVEKNTDMILYEGQENLKKALLSFYEKQAEKINLMFQRENDELFYSSPFTDCRYTYVYCPEKSVQGYVSFVVDRSSSRLYVNEILSRDAESLKKLLGFLRVYEGNIRTVVFQNLFPDSVIFDMLCDTAKIKRSATNLASARIHNLMAILKKHRYPMEKGSFCFFADDLSQRNRGYYTVRYENGTAEITKAESGTADVALDTCAMAKIFLCGTRDSFQSLSFRRGVKIYRENSDFLRAFPERRSMMWISY